MALVRYGNGSTTDAVMQEIRRTGESGNLRLCDSGDGAIDREIYFFREEIEGEGRNRGYKQGQRAKVQYIYMPNMLRIDGVRGIRRLAGMLEKDVRRKWLAPMIIDIFANAMEAAMSNSITSGMPAYEDMKQAWLKRGKVTVLVMGTQQYNCYPKDDEVVFVPMLNTIDQQLSTNSLPNGMGAQPVSKTIVTSDGEERVVPNTKKRNRNPAKSAQVDAAENPEETEDGE